MMTDLSLINTYKMQWKAMAESLVRAKLGVFESIGSSNRIEGDTLSDEEAEKLLSLLSSKSFRSRDEEVAGYSDALNIIQRNYSDIPLTVNCIRQLHSILLKYSLKDEGHRDKETWYGVRRK